jgi:hypothetical protein
MTAPWFSPGPDIHDILGKGDLLLAVIAGVLVFIVYLWFEHKQHKWEEWRNRERDD